MEPDHPDVTSAHAHVNEWSRGSDDEADDDEELDPRIQRELDQLNLASTDINSLENELDEARSKYRSIVSETSNRMEAIAHDRKKSIQKSREYYRMINDSKLAQGEALKAARQFQSATGVYTAAKETVALAERSLTEKTEAAASQLSSAWQEMLSNAVSKVTEAEKEKTRCENEHRRRAAKFSEIGARKVLLEKKFSRSIKKAKPYFELKAELDLKLMQQKQNVTDLQAAIKANKIKYNAALKRLEKISEEIHQSRQDKLWAKVPRLPCVGAETESICSGMSELELDTIDGKFETDSLSFEGESLGDYPNGAGIVFDARDDSLDHQPLDDTTDETNNPAKSSKYNVGDTADSKIDKNSVVEQYDETNKLTKSGSEHVKLYKGTGCESTTSDTCNNIEKKNKTGDNSLQDNIKLSNNLSRPETVDQDDSENEVFEDAINDIHVEAKDTIVADKIDESNDTSKSKT